MFEPSVNAAIVAVQSYNFSPFVLIEIIEKLIENDNNNSNGYFHPRVLFCTSFIIHL